MSHFSLIEEGDRGAEDREKGGGRCSGGRRREGGKRDYKGGVKWEKKGKIMQHCAIFCNQKNAKRQEPTNHHHHHCLSCQQIQGRNPE